MVYLLCQAQRLPPQTHVLRPRGCIVVQIKCNKKKQCIFEPLIAPEIKLPRKNA